MKIENRQYLKMATLVVSAMDEANITSPLLRDTVIQNLQTYQKIIAEVLNNYASILPFEGAEYSQIFKVWVSVPKKEFWRLQKAIMFMMMTK